MDLAFSGYLYSGSRPLGFGLGLDRMMISNYSSPHGKKPANSET